MTEVAVIAKPDLQGKRLSFALAEDRVAHYPEFRDFFVRTFDLDRKGLAEPGFVRAPSGTAYAFVFIGRSGEPFPSGVEIHAIVDALEFGQFRLLADRAGIRLGRPVGCDSFGLVRRNAVGTASRCSRLRCHRAAFR